MPWVHLLLNNVGCLLGSQINKRILWPDSPVALMECIRSDPLSPITVLIKEPEIPWCGHICLCSPAERTPCISLTVSHYRSIWAPQASASDGKTLKNHSRALEYQLSLQRSEEMYAVARWDAWWKCGFTEECQGTCIDEAREWGKEKSEGERARAGLAWLRLSELRFRSKSLWRWKWFPAIWKRQHFPLSGHSATVHLPVLSVTFLLGQELLSLSD